MEAPLWSAPHPVTSRGNRSGRSRSFQTDLARQLGVSSRLLKAWESVKRQGQGKIRLEAISPPGNKPTAHLGIIPLSTTLPLSPLSHGQRPPCLLPVAPWMLDFRYLGLCFASPLFRLVTRLHNHLFCFSFVFAVSSLSLRLLLETEGEPLHFPFLSFSLILIYISSRLG